MMICNNALLSLLDNYNMTPKDFLGDFDEFPFFKKENELKKELKKEKEEMDEWLSTIRETKDKISVTVPYDKDNETLTIEKNKEKRSFYVKVEYNDGLTRKSYSRTAYIPVEYSFIHVAKYDEKSKVMTFDFLRKEDNLKKAEIKNEKRTTLGEKLHDYFNKVKKETKNEDETSVKEETSTLVKQLEEGVRKTIEEYKEKSNSPVSVRKYKPIYGNRKRAYLIEF